MRRLTSKHIDIEEIAGYLINLWTTVSIWGLSPYTAKEFNDRKKEYIEQLYQLIK